MAHIDAGKVNAQAFPVILFVYSTTFQVASTYVSWCLLRGINVRCQQLLTHHVCCVLQRINAGVVTSFTDQLLILLHLQSS